MSADADARASVTSYLSRAGWAPDARGKAGDLWIRRATSSSSHVADYPAEIAVPWSLPWDSMTLRLLAEQIDEYIPVRRNAHATSAVSAIESELADVQTYRISNSHLVRGEASLDAAHTILGNARRLLRTAATAAYSSNPKPRIGSNYSKTGDAIVAEARLAHTRRGSFVFPVVLPIDPPPAKAGNELPLDEDANAPEAAERRVTRTLANALASLYEVAVRPEHTPKSDDVFDLIASGVTREFVVAVRTLATTSGTGKLDTSFLWAGAVESPGGVPARVEVPADAAERLDRVAKRLSASRRAPSDSVSGPIVAMRESPDGHAPGEINIQAIRNGRAAEVIVLVSPQQIHEAHDWARDRRAVIAYGAVESQAGQRPIMRDPRALRPVSEIYLDGQAPS